MKGYLGLSLVLVVLFGACKSDPQSPGFEYMPDMYRSKSLETYGEAPQFSNGMEAQQPAEGTIPRGFEVYPYANTPEDYELSGKNFTSPFPASEQVAAEGKVLYEKFCQHCHGTSGMGDGMVVKSEKWPGPPPAFNAALKDLPEGKIIHSITYGKGMMGSHASQLTLEERWKLVHYVQTLQQQ